MRSAHLLFSPLSPSALFQNHRHASLGGENARSLPGRLPGGRVALLRQFSSVSSSPLTVLPCLLPGMPQRYAHEGCLCRQSLLFCHWR